MNPNTVVWIYIVLLVAGGLFGYFKAGSKVSLITSAISAGLLVVAMIPGVFTYSFSRAMVDVIMAALLMVFAIRLTKTKKFMPSGLMLTLTLIALVLRHV